MVLQFLAERFTVVGVEFQYWMPIFAALVAVAIALSAWLHPTD
jgi:Na+-driven multidrug efflux pump